MSAIRIRPCPFCGGQGRVKTNQSGAYYYTRVQCVVCDSQSRTYRSVKSTAVEDTLAITAWNLRAYDKINPDDIDAIAFAKEFGNRQK